MDVNEEPDTATIIAAALIEKFQREALSIAWKQATASNSQAVEVWIEVARIIECDLVP